MLNLGEDFVHMDVSENFGTPKKSSILVGFFHYFHHPFWGTPIFGNTHIAIYICQDWKGSLTQPHP